VKGGLNPNKTTKSVGIFPHYALYTLLHDSFFLGGGGVEESLLKLLFLFMFSVSIVVHNFERSTEYTLKTNSLPKKYKIALKQKQQETVNTGIKLVGFLGVVEDAISSYFSSKARKKQDGIIIFNAFARFLLAKGKFS
jgi:hypothetical protein